MGIHRSNTPGKSPLQQGATAGGGEEKQRCVPVKAAEIQDSLAASCPPFQPPSFPAEVLHGRNFSGHSVSPVIPRECRDPGSNPPTAAGEGAQSSSLGRDRARLLGKRDTRRNFCYWTNSATPPASSRSSPVVFLSWGMWRWALSRFQGLLFGACLFWARKKATGSASSTHDMAMLKKKELSFPSEFPELLRSLLALGTSRCSPRDLPLPQSTQGAVTPVEGLKLLGTNCNKSR